MTRGDFRSKVDPKPPPQWRNWKEKKPKERKLGPAVLSRVLNHNVLIRICLAC